MGWVEGKHTRRKQRVMARIYALLKDYKEPMRAKDIVDNLWTAYSQIERNGRRHRTVRQYDTVCSATVGSWCKNDPNIRVVELPAGRRAYQWRGLMEEE